MSLNPVHIKATTLADGWFQALFKIMEEGRRFKIDRGSYAGQDRLEFDHVEIHFTYPDARPLVPELRPGLGIPNPVADNYLEEYLPYLMTSEEKPGEAYTYGRRICAARPVPLSKKYRSKVVPELYRDWKEEDILYSSKGGVFIGLNQMEAMIWTYKNKGHRNNQMILQVGAPKDMCYTDPPCLRHIDTRVQDGALHFFPYFRSWDLFGGFPANLAAIELMKEYCAEQIGVKNGEIIAISKGLHIYDYVFEIAAAIRGKSLDEFKASMQ